MTSRKSFIKVALDIALYSKIFFVLYYLYESYYALSVYVFASLLLTITLLYFHKLNKNSCSVPIIILVDFFLVPLVYTVAFGKLINPLIFYVSYFPLIFLMIDIRKKRLLITMFVCNMCLGLFSDVLSHYFLDGFSLYQFSNRQFLFVRNNLFIIIGGGLSYNVYQLLKKKKCTHDFNRNSPLFVELHYCYQSESYQTPSV